MKKSKPSFPSENHERKCEDRKYPRREYVEALVEVKDVLGEVVEIWGDKVQYPY